MPCIGSGAGSASAPVSGDRPTRLRDEPWARTVPGWALVAVVVLLVLTRESVSETLVGTLLGTACVLIGVPLTMPGGKAK